MVNIKQIFKIFKRNKKRKYAPFVKTSDGYMAMTMNATLTVKDGKLKIKEVEKLNPKDEQTKGE